MITILYLVIAAMCGVITYLGMPLAFEKCNPIVRVICTVLSMAVWPVMALGCVGYVAYKVLKASQR